MRWTWSKKSEEFLTPGLCECGHNRSSHRDGKGACTVFKRMSEILNCPFTCACQIYIPIQNDDGSDGPDYPPSEEVKELENLYKLKGPKK